MLKIVTLSRVTALHREQLSLALFCAGTGAFHCYSCVVTPRCAQLPAGAPEEGGEEEVDTRRREEKL